MSVDVAICTKDRPQQLRQCIQQVRQSIVPNKIIIVDSSTYFDSLDDSNVKVVHTPNALLGYARQQALTQSTTPVIAFIDDDITLEKGWFKHMLSALNSNPQVLAVSSKVVYGWRSDKIIEKLHRCGCRPVGGSVGISLMKRKEILAIGGFNVNVHRGEDVELHLRINRRGFKWIREHMAVAYHYMTLRKYWRKAKVDADGWRLIWHYVPNRLQFIMKRFASALIMPVYYGLLTHDIRVAAVYGSFKWKILYHFLKDKRSF